MPMLWPWHARMAGCTLLALCSAVCVKTSMPSQDHHVRHASICSILVQLCTEQCNAHVVSDHPLPQVHSASLVSLDVSHFHALVGWDMDCPDLERLDLSCCEGSSHPTNAVSAWVAHPPCQGQQQQQTRHGPQNNNRAVGMQPRRVTAGCFLRDPPASCVPACICLPVRCGRGPAQGLHGYAWLYVSSWISVLPCFDQPSVCMLVCTGWLQFSPAEPSLVLRGQSTRDQLPGTVPVIFAVSAHQRHSCHKRCVNGQRRTRGSRRQPCSIRSQQHNHVFTASRRRQAVPAGAERVGHAPLPVCQSWCA
jgi:hypothetical protein